MMATVLQHNKLVHRLVADLCIELDKLRLAIATCRNNYCVPCSNSFYIYNYFCQTKTYELFYFYNMHCIIARVLRAFSPL